MAIRHYFVYLFLLAAWVATAVFSLAVGNCGETIVGNWGDETAMSTFMRLTLPRFAIGTLAGASLAMAGAVFQSLFRNPLASPYTLGVSSGASLGASIAITLGLPVISPIAFIGALICVSVVYTVAHLKQSRSIGILLLAGITMGFICSALIVLILFLAKPHDATSILRWMMGSLQIYQWESVVYALIWVLLAAAVALYLHRHLDLMMMGETVAASRGVSVRWARRLLYFSASVLTAVIVAYCGPIGFVGLIIPHTMRYFVGPTHRRLILACALAGAVFLPLCDTIARNAIWWTNSNDFRQLPVGVLTNLIGGLFFLYLLLARRSQYSIS